MGVIAEEPSMIEPTGTLKPVVATTKPDPSGCNTMLPLMSEPEMV